MAGKQVGPVCACAGGWVDLPFQDFKYIYIIYNILISLIYIYIARALQTVTPNHPCLLARYSLQDVMKGKEARKDILSCTTCWICWANSTIDLYS